MRITTPVRVSFAVLSLVLLPVLGAAPSLAQQVEDAPFATTSIGRAAVHWDLLVENNGTALTVTGPGEFRWEEEFPAGEHPSFESVDVEGNRLPDGFYEYGLGLIAVGGGGIGGPLLQTGELVIQRVVLLLQVRQRLLTAFQLGFHSTKPFHHSVTVGFR